MISTLISEDESECSSRAFPSYVSKILEERYLLKNMEGKAIETPEEMFRRVAKAIAAADLIYDRSIDPQKTEDEFYRIMRNLEFLPNSPTLMNAGTEVRQLAACFVLPIEDSISSIFECLKNAALIHQTGAGTGFSFSNLRPKGDIIRSTKGVSSGPLSFLGIFNFATQIMQNGGLRRGANMGVLRVDHPDILDFVKAKSKEGSLRNFNLSVSVTNEFMDAVIEEKQYGLKNPNTGRVIKKIWAKDLFDLMATMAWRNGEPGIIFIDNVNAEPAGRGH